MKINIRKPFHPVDVDGISFDLQEGKTKQSFKDECNINAIVKKYRRTGQMPGVRENGIYSDNSSMDLFDAQLIVAKSNTMFNELPSEVRNKFGNNPVKFLEYAENPANQEGMIELGLAKRIPKTDPEPSQKTQKEEISKTENQTTSE